MENEFYCKIKKKGTLFTDQWAMVWTRLIVNLREGCSDTEA